MFFLDAGRGALGWGCAVFFGGVIAVTQEGRERPRAESRIAPSLPLLAGSKAKRIIYCRARRGGVLDASNSQSQCEQADAFPFGQGLRRQISINCLLLL